MQDQKSNLTDREEMEKLPTEELDGRISIENYPIKDCLACEGKGWIGRLPNKNVIPCPCVFKDGGRWSMAVYIQRNMEKGTPDKFKSFIQRTLQEKFENEKRGKK